MAKWGEIKCPRCAELEAQITAMEEGLTAVHMAGYMDGKKAAEAKLAKAVKLYRIALADAIRRPMGVVPASAEELVTTAELDAAEQRRAAIREGEE